MPYGTVTLSSGNLGASTAIPLNGSFGGKPFRLLATTNPSVAIGDFTIAYTLQPITSSNAPTSVAPTWTNFTAADFGISSAVASSAWYQAVHFTSSTIFPDGVSWCSQFPVNGVRLNSTSLSSNSISLTALQSEGW
jgi:hypothetical protein